LLSSSALEVKKNIRKIWKWCSANINNATIFLQRPTAKELLKHRFIKTAKKNTFLVELIERYKNWKQKCRDDDDSSSGEENEE